MGYQLCATVFVLTGSPANLQLAALYIELRRLHDGVAAQSLDAVFA